MFFIPLRHVTRPILRCAQLHTTACVASDFESYKPPQASSAQDVYTKQQDETPEPRVSHTGTRTYVVSPKDSASYDVPGGAYGSSDPYLTPPKTPAPQTSETEGASTAPGAAHPNTTSRVPQHPDGVGESSAVRFRTAPGRMNARGGSDGGLGLMDQTGTTGANNLAERNPQPTDEGGKLGNAEAWKHRK